MVRARQVLLVVVLIGIMVLNGGCIVAAVGLGAGTVAYVRGDLQIVESAGIDDVYNASLKAVQELELHLVSKSKDALAAEIIAYDARDKKITIKLKAAAEGSTKLSIRIGVFGSETKSRLIYQKIHDILRS